MSRPVIYFDWDGTLGDSMALCFAEVSGALEELGYPPQPPELLAQCNGPTIRESAPLMGIRPEDVERYFEARSRLEVTLSPRYAKLYPGIGPLLRELLRYADLAIVSNGFGGYIRASAEACRVADCFVRIQGAVPPLTKPQLLARMLEEMRPARAAMVGDRLGDIRAGVENGLMTVAVTYGYGSEEEWRDATARAATVEELREQLLAWLAQET